MAHVPYRWLRSLRIKNVLVREFLAEFWGTFILILIGDAAFAQAFMGGHGIDIFAIVFAWGVAVLLGVAVAGGITGGHINPAVTFALATLGKLPWKKVPVFILAQHLGAFVASAVLFFTYLDVLDHFDANRTLVGKTGTGLIWATYPREYVSIATCFLDQIVGTGILMFTAMATIDARNTNIPKYLHGLVLGLMICAVAMCFGVNCMAPLNPARDFATRAFTAVAGWGSETFSFRGYNYWWIGVVGPHVGAVIGGWLYYLSIELHLPDPEEDADNLAMEPLNEATTMLSKTANNEVIISDGKARKNCTGV